MQIPIEFLGHAIGLKLPEYATPHSAGLDLMAACPEEEPIILKPSERGLVPTGLKIALPDGYEAQIRPRSGLAFRYGLTVLNAPGTIDADYRGEVKVLLVNLGKESYTIYRGDRVAQMVVAPYVRVDWQLVPQLEETLRGEGGFGHTGL
ncbi:MAG: dUTP diphosphatase [Rhodothermia bacterium]|nr:dUTP diphosphatase [Rhodothermia bacterium]